jgi:hypothetical protein
VAALVCGIVDAAQRRAGNGILQLILAPLCALTGMVLGLMAMTGQH